MVTKQAKNVQTENVASAPMAMPNFAGEVCKREPERPPQYEESRKLIDEARRALTRAVIHAATHNMSYDLNRTSKALQALNY